MFPVDVKRFYGGTGNVVAVIPYDGNESEDEALSDDEMVDNKQAEENALNNDDAIYQTENTDEDYSSEDEVPLAQLCKQTSSTKNKKLWRPGNLQKDDEKLLFSATCNLPEEIKCLDTPLNYFQFLFPRTVTKHIVDQTLLYSVQKRPEKPLRTTEHDIDQFIGICLYMSLINLPATRDYWTPALGHPTISEVMSVKMFEELKRFIHFNDNDAQVEWGQPGYDKLHKIRPLVDMLKQRLLLVPKEEKLCVDEQIVPFKGRIGIKQYNPKKPHKWGYKIFVLSGVSGFSYDFELFTGASDNKIMTDEPDLGASSNVVVRMARSIPRNQNFQLYFDNWFNSLPLQVYLYKEGILSLGTIRRNRLGGCSFPSEKELKRNGRGSYSEKVCTTDGVDLSAIACYGNKVVYLLSTFVGSKPEMEVKRYFASEKKHKMIPCPKAIKTYNQHMGGVDLLDSLLGYYRIKIRSKKWYLRIFFHMLDLTLVNAWLLYKRNTGEKLALKDFKACVAEGLCHAGKPVRKRGRPFSDVQNLLEEKKARGSAAVMPTRDVRLDNIGHLPNWLETRQRCKMPTCKGFTYVSCEKCKVTLCFHKNKNCYKMFHSNE